LFVVLSPREEEVRHYVARFHSFTDRADPSAL
jgi:hypothetical protein